MICRIWHGYTANENADVYEKLLREEIFEGINAREIEGYRGIQLLRRLIMDETEFITIMWFDSIDAVVRFAGTDYEEAVVPGKARRLLKRYDKRSQHYDLKESSVHLDF